MPNKRILVPIDGSPSSMRALAYVVDSAQKDGGLEVRLVNVHEAPVIYGEIAIYVPKERMERLQQEHSEALLKPAEDLLKVAGIPYVKAIKVGDIATTIAKYAEDLGCSAIVMGTRGMGALGNLALGSIATKVVHQTKLPVTLVK